MSVSEINKKKLGFGLMRLPTETDGSVDTVTTGKMIDEFLANGYTYFDSGYGYLDGNSEKCTKELLFGKYARTDFTFTTKLPLWAIKEGADKERIFEEQLSRTGADFFDVYLLHNYNGGVAEVCEKYDLFGYVSALKRDGLVKHIGMSFHDSAELLDKTLTAHPELEVVQLQINYLDWEDSKVQSRLCYETARRHGKEVIIMEPIKGGSLAHLPDDVAGMLLNAEPGSTLASWALRFAASLDGVAALLSGMSTPEQLHENIRLFEDIKPVTAEERELLADAVKKLNAIPTLPCTACGYCMEDCPIGMPIPKIISAYNRYQRTPFMAPIKRDYGLSCEHAKVKASDCLSCGACAARCPQHIDIPEALRKAAELFE